MHWDEPEVKLTYHEGLLMSLGSNVRRFNACVQITELNHIGEFISMTANLAFYNRNENVISSC
jgi:hypothetical protein